MEKELVIKPIAVIKNDFKEKFGIPRQSGRAPSLLSKIVFLPEYKNPDALRGIEEFSHLWLLFNFSKAHKEGWSATVRPPRLGGNTRVGVFASRSPFRPNPIGLSCVKLERIEKGSANDWVLIVSGADLLDGTPIFDIKPYISMDCHSNAVCGFQESTREDTLQVEFPEDLLALIEPANRDGLLQVLAQDPRPSYQDDPKRVYGFPFGGFDVRFRVASGVLTVVELVRI